MISSNFVLDNLYKAVFMFLILNSLSNNSWHRSLFSQFCGKCWGWTLRLRHCSRVSVVW